MYLGELRKLDWRSHAFNAGVGVPGLDAICWLVGVTGKGE